MNQLYFEVEGAGSLDAYLVEYYFVFWVKNRVFSTSIRNRKSLPKNFDHQISIGDLQILDSFGIACPVSGLIYYHTGMQH